MRHFDAVRVECTTPAFKDKFDEFVREYREEVSA